MPLRIVILGGGDLASGVALRLFRLGCQLIVTELAQPYAVRRTVSFAESVYVGKITIEGVSGILYPLYGKVIFDNCVPVLIDPEMTTIGKFKPDVLVDARMIKQEIPLRHYPGIFTIGLGPGFIAGKNCHAVIETQRGHSMGRVIYEGAAEADTGIPERVANFQYERVLRSPSDGIFRTELEIGNQVKEGEIIGHVGANAIPAPFSGMIRGLLHNGLEVRAGLKIGDIDPRVDPKLYQNVSDKALAVGGGVMEAILTKAVFRQKLSN
jgi:xanthine dehydrogenase accessory factor